jgi:hypothetical protein
MYELTRHEMAGERNENSMGTTWHGTAWERHGMCELTRHGMAGNGMGAAWQGNGMGGAWHL